MLVPSPVVRRIVPCEGADPVVTLPAERPLKVSVVVPSAATSRPSTVPSIVMLPV